MKKNVGIGLIAERSFKKGDTVLKLKGKIINSPTKTSIQLFKNKHIEDLFGKYINHNCYPNTKINKNKVVAIKNISSGNEITFNYNENEDKLSNPFICTCCNKKIKGLLNKSTISI